MSADATGYTLFDTAIGTCGVAWSAAGLVRVQLPEASAEATRARLARAGANAEESTPPPLVADAIATIVAHLRGDVHAMDDVMLDAHALGAFARAVYDATRRIPPGETRTYGAIAATLGDAGGARAVGTALGRNPWPIVVPCHRVIGARGAPGGFSAYGGLATKHRLLAIEGWHPDSVTLDLFTRAAG